MTPPGHRLRRIAARVCDRTTMVTVIDPAIADLQHEAEMAQRSGRRRTRPSLGRYAAVWQVVGYGISRSLIRGAMTGFTAERALVRRTLLVAWVAGSAITVLLALLPLLLGPRPSAVASPGLLFLCLLPQAAALGIPIGLSCAVVFAMRARPLAIGLVASFCALALLASGLTVVILEWLVPDANQAFRTVASGTPVARGLGELGLTALARRSDAASILVLHARLSLAAATFTLAAPGLVVVRLFRRRWVAVVAWSVSVTLYFACASTLAYQLGPRAPILAAWGPAFIFVAAATAVLVARPRSVQRRP